jgi:glycosyltransferase involved in cell wall biosynthesis
MISIVIPVYEMKGLGVSFLRRGLDSINKQVIGPQYPIEVIVSDHSKNEDIANFIGSYSSRFPIRHCLNTSGHGNISQNVNVGIEKAQYPYVKILFQDDLLVETHYLQTIANIIRDLAPDCILTSATHTTNTVEFTGDMVPRDNEFLLFGQNTISDPSVLTIRKSILQEIPFDENVKLLMDCEFYYHLFKHYPNFFLAKEIRIAIGVWSGQTQGDLTTSHTVAEIAYLLTKYPNDGLREKVASYCTFLADKDTALAKALRKII